MGSAATSQDEPPWWLCAPIRVSVVVGRLHVSEPRSACVGALCGPRIPARSAIDLPPPPTAGLVMSQLPPPLRGPGAANRP